MRIDFLEVKDGGWSEAEEGQASGAASASKADLTSTTDETRQAEI